MKEVIVDCDAGIDDALALIILFAAHKHKRINIRAVTCVYGNTSVQNVVKNVFRTMEACDITDVPVYEGAYCSLIDSPQGTTTNCAIYNHGSDGFGDVFKNTQDTSKMRKPHAAYALYKLAADLNEKVTVICLGPLTNLALAIRMYPNFTSHVKELYIMGGNSTAQGNVTAQAEFNFYNDPESAHIVLNNICKPIWLLPWESCLKSQVTHEWRKDVLGQVNSPIVELMNQIENSVCLQGKRLHFYTPCDAFLAAILIRSDMAKNVILWHADIELGGLKTRGQVVLDHLRNGNRTNVHLIQDFDSEIFKDILYFAMDLKSLNTSVLYP